MTSGDIVRTGVNASAMIVLANHTILLMLERTEIEMRGPSRLRLSDGYVTVILDEWPRLLTLPMPDNNALLTIDVPHGVIALTAAGDYDLDVEARTPATSSALVTVHAGHAQLTALETDVDGRDSLDRVHELSLGPNQAGLLRAGTIPVLMPPTLSPHRVATDAFVRLTRDVIRGVHIPGEIADRLADALRESQSDKERFSRTRLMRLQQQQLLVQAKITRRTTTAWLAIGSPRSIRSEETWRVWRMRAGTTPSRACVS